MNPKKAADLILHNGHITTLDPKYPEAKSVAIKDGRVVLWDLKTNQLAAARGDWPRKAHSMAIAPDGMKAAVGDDDDDRPARQQPTEGRPAGG